MSKVKQFEFAKITSKRGCKAFIPLWVKSSKLNLQKLQVKEAAKLSRLYLGNQLKGEAILWINIDKHVGIREDWFQMNAT